MGGKEELVEKSLRNYFLNNTDFQSQSSNKECQWLALVEMQNSGSKLRTVMEGGSTESSTRLEEYRISSDYPPPLNLFLSNLYRRLWGVLLVEKPNALEKDQSKFAIHVEEWHMAGLGSLDRPNFSKPIVPPNNVYSVGLLSQMWTLKKEKDCNELHQKRWKLFSYIISPLLNSEVLQRFENKMFLICQLFIFQHEDEVVGPLLYGWEIRVLIILHFLMKRITESRNQMDFISLPDPRGVCVATLYTRSMIYLVNLVVGEVVEKKYLLNLNNFDGQLFQWLYIKAKSNESIECLFQYLLSDERHEMEKIYLFVTSNGRNIRNLRFNLTNSLK